MGLEPMFPLTGVSFLLEDTAFLILAFALTKYENVYTSSFSQRTTQKLARECRDSNPDTTVNSRMS